MIRFKIVEVDPALLEFRIDGKLEKSDYQQLSPLVENLIKRGGVLAMVIHITHLLIDHSLDIDQEEPRG